MLQGSGRAKWPDGSLYEGEWKDGAPNKEGRMVYSDGSYYIGAFISEKRHGIGKQFDSAGRELYSGEWQDDRKHGMGTQTDDSERYEGLFVRDKK